MKNRSLAADYLKRADARLAAIQVLFDRESWADVVRESQEVVELALKALLRVSGVEVPRIHDVGDIVVDQAARLPLGARPHAEELAEISRALRRDRELAFYGSEDLTPSDFYKRKDADRAFKQAKRVVAVVTDAC